MEKVSMGPANWFCPQALFLYGTYTEDGMPHFGTFTWFSYCWDGELSVMASIGEGKLTLDRIRANKVFSANLVTEPLLPLADYWGTNPGYTTPEKMEVPVEIQRGSVLPVPVLGDSPWVFELEAARSIPLEGNELFLCKIRNVLAARELTDETKSAAERLEAAAPVLWISKGAYFPISPVALGATGDWENLHPKKA